MFMLALHIRYFFMASITQQNDPVWRKVNGFYSRYMQRANTVLKRSKFLEPMPIEFKTRKS